VLANHFPNQFAGITLSNNNATVNIFVTGSDARLTSTVRRLVPRDFVNYVTVVNTWRSLLAVHHELQASLSVLRADGIDIAAFSTDPSTNRENIEVVHLRSGTTKILDREFGPSVITVRGVTKGQLPVPLATTW
jgi:hypothetical protein